MCVFAYVMRVCIKAQRKIKICLLYCFLLFFYDRDCKTLYPDVQTYVGPPECPPSFPPCLTFLPPSLVPSALPPPSLPANSSAAGLTQDEWKASVRKKWPRLAWLRVLLSRLWAQYKRVLFIRRSCRFSCDWFRIFRKDWCEGRLVDQFCYLHL